MTSLFKFSRYNSRVRQFKAYLNALDVHCEQMSMLILELQRNVHGGSNWQNQGFVKVKRGNLENVRNKDIQHHNLLSVLILFFHDQGCLSIAFECFDCLLSTLEFDNWLIRVFVLV